MIVIDESISYADEVLRPIARWYPGAVKSVRELRPNARLLDPELPAYLMQLRQPTLVTINYRDFWQRKFIHPAYCIICLKLNDEDVPLIPDLLRDILRQPEFNTKRKRMGKVISWTPSKLEYLTK